MNEIKISCVMAIYKENKKLLKRSIESILNQDFDNFEFIIILDNPENIEAEELINEYKKNDDRILFIKNKKNLGKGEARNNGILRANGKYIAIMDADDFSYKNRFKVQYDFLEKNKEIDVLFPSYRKIFPNRKIIEYICDNYSLEETFLSGEGHLNGGMMIKTSVFKDNIYKLAKAPEEFELFIRLIKNGYKFFTTKDILYDYIITEKDLDYRFRSNNYGNRQFLLLLTKNIILLKGYRHYYKVLLRTLFFYLITRNKLIFNFIIKIKNKI